MKYQVAVSVACVFIWSVAPNRAFCEADFLLTRRRTTSVGWSSSDRTFHVTVTRLES